MVNPDEHRSKAVWLRVALSKSVRLRVKLRRGVPHKQNQQKCLASGITRGFERPVQPLLPSVGRRLVAKAVKGPGREAKPAILVVAWSLDYRVKRQWVKTNPQFGEYMHPSSLPYPSPLVPGNQLTSYICLFEVTNRNIHISRYHSIEIYIERQIYNPKSNMYPDPSPGSISKLQPTSPTWDTCVAAERTPNSAHHM